MIRFVSLFILTSCFFTPSLAHACHGTTLSESIWMLFSKPFFKLFCIVMIKMFNAKWIKMPRT